MKIVLYLLDLLGKNFTQIFGHIIQMAIFITLSSSDTVLIAEWRILFAEGCPDVSSSSLTPEEALLAKGFALAKNAVIFFR